ncbi:MAG: DsbA family protein [Candidatus Micrarchaeota archaeon]
MDEEKSTGFTSNQMIAALAIVGLFVVLGLVLTINDMNNRMSEMGEDVSSLSALLLKNQENPTGNDNVVGEKKQVQQEQGIDLSGKTPKGTGDLVIVEYSDFQCSFCSRAVPTVKQIIEEYGDKVRIYYKHFPLSQIHPNAQKAAEASECAADQGKFWEYHDKLFENQGSLGDASLKKYAGELGLVQDTFDACLDGGEKSEQVQAELKEGLNYGVQGTPSFLINGKLVVGAQPFEVFKQAIDVELG